MLSKDPAEWERKIRKGGQKKDDFVKLARYLPVKNIIDRLPPDCTPLELAEYAGINVGTARRWLSQPNHKINYLTADKIAIKGIGVHPANIWGELWWVPEGEDHTWAWKYIDDPDYWA